MNINLLPQHLQVSLVPMGSQLFQGDVLAAEHSWSLMMILDYAKRDENIYFIDDNIERVLSVNLLIPFDGRFNLVFIMGFLEVSFLLDNLNRFFSMLSACDKYFCL